jgi:hypothetical protein
VSLLAPLSLAELAALLVLAFGLLAWLHLRTPRPVRTRVMFLGAWDEVAPASAASPARWTLTRSWGLLRAMFLVTLIGIALSDPQPQWFVGPKHTTLIVLDAGAHMRAIDEKPSRFERARVLAANELAARSTRDDVMVAQLDSALTPLSGWIRDPQQRQAAVAAARVTHEATRFSAAAEFARDHLRGKPHPELILISDGAFRASPSELGALRDAGIALRQLPVGTSSMNLAIRTFAVRAYPWDAERCEAMVELENTDGQPHAVELTLFEESRPIDVRPLRLPPRSRTRHFIAVGATGRRFSARIEARDRAVDAQPSDDDAYAVLAQLPPRRVLLVSSGQRYLESALALDSSLVVDKISPDAYRAPTGYDLAIFDQFVPPEPAQVATLWLAPNASSVDAPAAPYRVLGTIERPFFDEVATDNPMLRSVSLRDVNIRKAQRVQAEPGDQILARSKVGPLIVQGERRGFPFIALAFDVRESDVVLRTAWPILLSQMVRQLTAASGAGLEVPLLLGQLQPRDVVAYPSAGNRARPERAQLRAPSGRITDLPIRDRRVWLTPDESGLYELTTAGPVQLLAANSNAEAAAQITPRIFAPKPASKSNLARVGLTGDVPWRILIAVALLLLGIEAQLTRRGWRS